MRKNNFIKFIKNSQKNQNNYNLSAICTRDDCISFHRQVQDTFPRLVNFFYILISKNVGTD
jgi:hypothetical protein